jgi:hypothetical protein
MAKRLRTIIEGGSAAFFSDCFVLCRGKGIFMSQRIFVRPASVFLCWCLLLDLIAVGPLGAQTNADIAALNIIVMEAEGSLNNIKARTAREPIVRVEDDNHKPVAGVLVTFIAPGDGPSGTFLNGAKSIQQVTDMNGVAKAGRFRPNTATGQFQIQVVASFNGKFANAVIHQSNILPTTGTFLGLSAKSWIIITSVAAAGGVGAGIAAGRSSGSGTTITAGGGTVTAPR